MAAPSSRTWAGRSRDGEPKESVRYIRPAALPGVEALQATFVSHRYGAHLHDGWTVAAVDRGAASFELEGTRHHAPAGSLFLIPPHAMHTGEPAAPSGYRYRVIYLQSAASLGGLPEPLTGRPRHRLPVVLRHGELAADLARLHGLLVFPGRALEQGETVAAVTRELADLVRGCQGTEPRPWHAGVGRALEYIRAHWREDFTLGDLAAAAQLSQFYLVRVFHRHVGVPPSAYRRALRVRVARDMLRAGAAPAEAAAECGFYDQPHLTRHFKLVTGVTPRQYLRGGR